MVVQGHDWSEMDYSIGFEAIKGENTGIRLILKTYKKIDAYDIIKRDSDLPGRIRITF